MLRVHPFAVLAFFAVVTVAARPAAAQATRTPSSYDKEIGVAYSVFRDEGVTTQYGFTLDAAFKVFGSGAFRVQAVVAASLDHFAAFSDEEYDYEADTYKELEAGIRVGSVGSSKVRPFAQFLVGVQFCCDTRGAIYEPGGGLNFAVTSAIDVRVAVGFPIASYDGERFKQLHITIGVAFPLGR